MGEKKSISEEVELQLFLIMAFFVAGFFLLSSVQYSKQSSSTIAYISTVRNGRQRIKNRHQKKARNVSSVN
jgi:hypothetical protein